MLLNLLKKNKLVRNFLEVFTQKWITKKLRDTIPLLHIHEKVIDIGAGNCYVAHHLQQRNIDITALDVEDLSVVPSIRPVVYDGHKMPFGDRSFDTALLLTVLHHTTDPVAILQETQRIAKRIIIIEDTYTNVVQQYLTYAMDTLVNLGHSQMTYQNKSAEEWLLTFEQLGLKVESVQHRRVLFFFRQTHFVVRQ